MADVCYETPQKQGQQALHLYSIANFVASAIQMSLTLSEPAFFGVSHEPGGGSY